MVTTTTRTLPAATALRRSTLHLTEANRTSSGDGRRVLSDFVNSRDRDGIKYSLSPNKSEFVSCGGEYCLSVNTIAHWIGSHGNKMKLCRGHCS